MILVNIMGTWKVKKLYWNVLLVSFPTACGGIWLFSKCICVHRSSHSQWELAATGAGAHTRGGSSRRPGQELTLAATGAVAHTRSDRGRSTRHGGSSRRPGFWLLVDTVTDRVLYLDAVPLHHISLVIELSHCPIMVYRWAMPGFQHAQATGISHYPIRSPSAELSRYPIRWAISLNSLQIYTPDYKEWIVAAFVAWVIPHNFESLSRCLWLIVVDSLLAFSLL